MKLDLTSEIKLNNKYQKIYRRCQVALYLLALIFSIYFSLLILFPTQNFNFSFTMLTSNKGNALNPRLENGTLIKNGQANSDKKIYFDTSLVGNYSKVRITIDAGKKSSVADGTTVELRKSFRSFLYPEGEPIGFREGSLIKNSADHYIVSRGQLLKFKDASIMSQLGYSSETFIEADKNELRFNPSGEEITSGQDYPSSSLFRINNDYYILNDRKLDKFISEKAFLSRYDMNQAVMKDEPFFQKYPASGNILGFADGTLVAYGTGAYLVSQGRIYPIGDPEIFLNQGFNWDDVIPISGDEFSLYQKEKLFNLTSPHPQGTVFLTEENSAYYLVGDNKKHLLPSNNIASTWLKKNPVKVSLKSLDTIEKCVLGRNGQKYHCEIALDNFQSLDGQYYEYILKTKNDIKMDNLNVLYTRNKTLNNLKLTIHDLILKIKGKYGIQTSQTPQ